MLYLFLLRISYGVHILESISKHTNMILNNLVNSSIMSRIKDPSAQVSGLKFVLVSVIFILLIIPTVLNCNKDYSTNNVGFAIIEKHRDNTRVNMISKDEATILSRNLIEIKGTLSLLDKDIDD